MRAGLGAGDLGYCYYIRSAEAMRGLHPSAVTFLAMQLSQSLNTRRMVAHYRNLRERMLYTVESRLVRGYEAWVWRDFTRCVLIGEEDVAEIRAVCRERDLPEIDVLVPRARNASLWRASAFCQRGGPGRGGGGGLTRCPRSRATARVVRAAVWKQPPVSATSEIPVRRATSTIASARWSWNAAATDPTSSPRSIAAMIPRSVGRQSTTNGAVSDAPDGAARMPWITDVWSASAIAHSSSHAAWPS